VPDAQNAAVTGIDELDLAPVAARQPDAIPEAVDLVVEATC
jgi:hypothetical protein